MKGFDIRSAVATAFKFRIRAGMFFCFAILMAVAASLVMTPQYAASSKVLVKIGRELIYRPEVGNTQAALPTLDKDTLIASNIALMTSPDIARTVLDTIGIKTLYPKLVEGPTNPIMIWIGQKVDAVKDALGMTDETVETRALRQFGKKLSVDAVKKTDLVAVSFMHPDPVIAARVANMVVDLFQQKSGNIYANPNLQYAQDTVDKQRAALSEAEGRLSDFQRKYGVYDLDSQMALLLKQRIEIDTGIKSADAHVSELQGMVATLTAQRATTPQTIKLFSETERHRSIDDTQGQLLTLQLQEKQLASRYTDNYQPLKDVRSQIKTAEAALGSQRGDSGAHARIGVNDTYRDLNEELMRRQAELQSTTDRRDAMMRQIGLIDTSTAQLSERQRELHGLQQDVALRTDEVKTSYDKLVEARATEGLNKEKPASFSVVEAATPPDLADQARPLPALYTVAAAAGGIVGGIILIFFSHRLSGTFVTPEQASRTLNMPVLAVINDDRRYKGEWRKRWSTEIGLLQDYSGAGSQLSRKPAWS